MWTIVLACIPGVNIIALFLLAFLSKKQPKRTFAAAALVLMLIVAILIFVAFLVFPSELLSFGEWLRARTPLQGAGMPLEQKKQPSLPPAGLFPGRRFLLKRGVSGAVGGPSILNFEIFWRVL